jgi:hypothetical protein
VAVLVCLRTSSNSSLVKERDKLRFFSAHQANVELVDMILNSNLCVGTVQTRVKNMYKIGLMDTQWTVR